MITRTTLGRSCAVVLSFALSQIATPFLEASNTHLVDSQQMSGRIAEYSAKRQEQISLLQDVLSRSEAQHQARVMGLNVDKMRSAVPHLSDSELKDLSQRAQQVKDVAAGHSGDDTLVIVGLILLLAGLAVLVAVEGYDDSDDCDYCY